MFSVPLSPPRPSPSRALPGPAPPTPSLSCPVKPIFHLCKPHYETNTQYLGIRKIGFHYYRVFRITTVYVNVFCRKSVVSVRVDVSPAAVLPQRADRLVTATTKKGPVA